MTDKRSGRGPRSRRTGETRRGPVRQQAAGSAKRPAMVAIPKPGDHCHARAPAPPPTRPAPSIASPSTASASGSGPPSISPTGVGSSPCQSGVARPYRHRRGKRYRTRCRPGRLGNSPRPEIVNASPPSGVRHGPFDSHGRPPHKPIRDSIVTPSGLTSRRPPSETARMLRVNTTGETASIMPSRRRTITECMDHPSRTSSEKPPPSPGQPFRILKYRGPRNTLHFHRTRRRNSAAPLDRIQPAQTGSRRRTPAK
jgi:hypothetical protein